MRMLIKFTLSIVASLTVSANPFGKLKLEPNLFQLEFNLTQIKILASCRNMYCEKCRTFLVFMV